MRRERIRLLRSLSIAGATILLGISWSFAVLHIRTASYPLLWAAAMPLLAFYYFSGEKRYGGWKHLPAAALSIYAVVLWQVTKSYGATGTIATVLGVVASTVAVWLGGRTALLDGSVPRGQITPVQQPSTPVRLGSGVARRRRLRTAGNR